MNKFIHNIILLTVMPLTFIATMYIGINTIHASDCFNINGESIENNSNARPFVCFQHDIHNEKADIDKCNACHHIYDEQGKLVEGESSEGQSCSECHTGNAVSTKSKGSKQLDINLAVKYHALCRNCHLEKEKGPVVCGECHRQR